VRQNINPVRAKAGFFSLTAVTAAERADEETKYLRWHLLDHMPEQYRLPGVVHGLRWIADQQHCDARLVARPPLDRLGNIVHYIFADPVEQTLADFIDLGAELRDVGRFPVARKPLRLSALRLHAHYASPRASVSAEVIPFRPHRGVMVLIEEPVDGRAERWLHWLHAEHYATLLDHFGTAGAWMFDTPVAPQRPSPAWAGERHFVTVIYLDEDPIETTARLAPLIEQRWASGEVRPILAAPLRSMIAWEAWR
jgi:hypothetical protein